MYNIPNNHWLKHIDFIIADTISLILSLWIAVSIRIDMFALFRYTRYKEMLVLVLLLHIFYIAAYHPYSGILWRTSRNEIRCIAKHISFIILGFVFYNFLLKQAHFYSRQITIFFTVFSIIFFFLERFILKEVIKKRNKHYNRDVLLAANTKDATKILNQIKENYPTGFNITGIVLFNSSNKKEIEKIPIIARNEEELIQYIEMNPVDEIILSNPETKSYYQNLLNICTDYGLTMHIIINHTNLSGDKSLEKIADFDAVTSCMKLVSGTDLFFKRCLDIIGSIIGLFITLLLTIIVGPLIYTADPGPIFFTQPRIGKNGRVIKIYKFRSMYQDAEQRKASLMEQNEMQGQIFKMENDPRIIGSGKDGKRKGIGWLIRAFSIDEFPQFLNVLKGEMSIVGTRPPTIDEWQQYSSHHRKRMRVKPGITGLWQVSGRNEITDFEDIVMLDTQYIYNWSIWLDIKILIKTVLVVITRKGSK